jgi:hypothetical protein
MGSKKRKKDSKEKKGKKERKKNCPLWIGQGHLYQPADEKIRSGL